MSLDYHAAAPDETLPQIKWFVPELLAFPAAVSKWGLFVEALFIRLPCLEVRDLT